MNINETEFRKVIIWGMMLLVVFSLNLNVYALEVEEKVVLDNDTTIVEEKDEVVSEMETTDAVEKDDVVSEMETTDVVEKDEVVSEMETTDVEEKDEPISGVETLDAEETESEEVIEKNDLEDEALDKDDQEKLVDTHLNPDENMFNNIPKSYTLDMTDYEAVCGGAKDAVWNIIKSQLENEGYDLTNVTFGFVFQSKIGIFSYRDIHKANIWIQDTYNPEGNYKNYSFAEIELNYTRSVYNDEDAKYVNEKIAPIWFNSYDAKDINSSRDYKTAEEVFTEMINDDSIQMYAYNVAGNVSIINASAQYILFFFKNNVLYGFKDGLYSTHDYITIPNETKENTQAYIDYALPIVKEKFGEGYTLSGIIASEKEPSTVILLNVKYCFLNEDGTANEIIMEDIDLPGYRSRVAFYRNSFELYNDGEYVRYTHLLKEDVLNVNDELIVNAKLSDDAYVTVDSIDDDLLEEMLEYIKNHGMGNVISSHEVKLYGTATGDITLTFKVDEKYNGRDAYILHKKHDGTYEKFLESVNTGKITITVSDLSPFVISIMDEENKRVLDNQPKTGIKTNKNSNIIIELIILFISTLSLYKLKREV